MEQGPLTDLEFYVPMRGSWGDLLVREAEYERESLNTLKSLASDGTVLYDVGAHVGVYTLAWLRMGGSQAEAFEPVPGNVSVLREAVMRNHVRDSVRIHSLALSDNDGEMMFKVHQSDTSRGRLVRSESSHVARSKYMLPVQTRRLDTVVEERNLPRPDVIKLDVEGAEHDVLKGGREIISKYRPLLLIEVHDVLSGIEISTFMTGMNYELNVLEKKGRNLIACLCTPRK